MSSEFSSVDAMSSFAEIAEKTRQPFVKMKCQKVWLCDSHRQDLNFDKNNRILIIKEVPLNTADKKRLIPFSFHFGPILFDLIYNVWRVFVGDIKALVNAVF